MNIPSIIQLYATTRRAPKMKNFIWAGESSSNPVSVDKEKGHPQNWLALFETYKKNNIDGIIFFAGNSSWKKAIDSASQAGLEYHIWKPMMISQDSVIEKDHPDWFAVRRDGTSTIDKTPYVDYYKWFCPNNNGVMEYLLKLVNSYTEDPRITSMHLDYIRYSDIYIPDGLIGKYNLESGKFYPEYDFCYCPTCRKLFQDEHGVDPLGDLSVKKKVNWDEFRLQSITNIVHQLKNHVHKRNKKISAAVFPGPSIAIKNVRQQWSEWDLDSFFPMNYNSLYNKGPEWIQKVVKEERKVLGKTPELYSGLFLDKMTNEDLKKAIILSMENGANGISLYSDALLTEELLKTFKQTSALFR